MLLPRHLRLVTVVAGLILTATHVLIAQGQAETEQALAIQIRRNIGYSFGAQMQGTFTIRAEGPDDLESVEFLLDGAVIAVDSEAPFSLALNTRDYSEGVHSIGAVGYRANGEQIHSASVSRQFVATSTVTIVVIAMVVLVIAFRAGSYYLGRRRGGRSATYGYLGGTVCPSCGRTFAIHWWSMRFGVGRYDRCPHCGKWNMIRRAATDVLLAAEAPENKKHHSRDGRATESEEEAFRRRVEESRYDQG